MTRARERAKKARVRPCNHPAERAKAGKMPRTNRPHYGAPIDRDSEFVNFKIRTASRELRERDEKELQKRMTAKRERGTKTDKKTRYARQRRDSR